MRIGPGQFLVEAERVASGFAFTVDGRVFAVVSDPVIVATSTYLATVREASGPGAGRELAVQLQVGRRVR